MRPTAISIKCYIRALSLARESRQDADRQSVCSVQRHGELSHTDGIRHRIATYVQPTASIVPGHVVEIRLPTLVEGVAALLGLVGHVGESGRLAGEDLLADHSVGVQIERVL